MGITTLTEIKIPIKSRDELPPVLRALQHIFMTPELNKKIFLLLEKKVIGVKKKTGRKGVDLCHILVLALVRHMLDTNWYRLELVDNYDLLTHKILGISA